MEISINAKQIVLLVWTLIAIVISLIVMLALGYPASSIYGVYLGGNWQFKVALFFGLFLVITIPVYLLVALWHIVSKWDST